MERSNLTGKRFFRLRVISFAYVGNGDHSYWNVECDCGIKKIVSGTCLNSGRTKSCGCLRKEISHYVNFKHGHATSKYDYKYRTWQSIKDRCNNPRVPNYFNYGGRGIKFYDEWNNSFESFLEYIDQTLGERPVGSSIDRINNDGNYEPGNIRWAHHLQQANNRRHRGYWYNKGGKW